MKRLAHVTRFAESEAATFAQKSYALRFPMTRRWDRGERVQSLLTLLLMLCSLLGASKDSPAQVSLSPSSVTLGKQLMGTISGTKPITVSNAGTGKITIKSASTSGDFAIRTTTCKTSLAAGAKCTYNIQFRPVQDGVRNGTLSVSYDTSVVTATLSATGARGQPRF